MLGNYSISKLKMCRNLISSQTKIDSLVLLTVPYSLSGKHFEIWNVLKAEIKAVWTT